MSFGELLILVILAGLAYRVRVIENQTKPKEKDHDSKIGS